MSFEQDVINRTTQKLAALVKRANELDGSAEAIPTPGTEDVKTHSYKDLENTDAYKNTAIPETTWFENLANSAPVSKLLDLAEATGVDRWRDSVDNFAGNVKDWGKEIADISDQIINKDKYESDTNSELHDLYKIINDNLDIERNQQEAIANRKIYNKITQLNPSIFARYGKPKFGDGKAFVSDIDLHTGNFPTSPSWHQDFPEMQRSYNPIADQKEIGGMNDILDLMRLGVIDVNDPSFFR